ncbi:MAG: hypothetical protein DMF85_04410 [Acidobacteria bacterium]|nr:MAG: hypothetical protein DMF85_04410 [Acidobacteriota bacterium]
MTPPSVDRNSPLPGPPLSRPHVWIVRVHMPANTFRGSRGSSSMSEQPLFSSVKSVRCQVCPPSVVRNTPRSCCGPYAWPSAHASNVFGSWG